MEAPEHVPHLVLQIVVVAVMEEQAEDVAGVDHSVDPTLLQLLAKPVLDRTQGLEQGHLCGREGAHQGAGAGQAFRRSCTVAIAAHWTHGSSGVGHSQVEQRHADGRGGWMEERRGGHSSHSSRGR